MWLMQQKHNKAIRQIRYLVFGENWRNDDVAYLSLLQASITDNFFGTNLIIMYEKSESSTLPHSEKINICKQVRVSTDKISKLYNTLVWLMCWIFGWGYFTWYNYTKMVLIQVGWDKY